MSARWGDPSTPPASTGLRGFWSRRRGAQPPHPCDLGFWLLYVLFLAALLAAVTH